MSPTEKTCLNPLFQKNLMEIFLLHLLTYLSHIWVLKILDSISRERWSNTGSIISITNTCDHFKTFFTSWLQKLRPKNTREASKMGHPIPQTFLKKTNSLWTARCLELPGKKYWAQRNLWNSALWHSLCIWFSVTLDFLVLKAPNYHLWIYLICESHFYN